MSATRVVLSRAQLEAIRRHGGETYPHECCGFLVGAREGDRARVHELVPAVNARDDSPRNRYLIPPEQFLRVQRDADARGLDIVGFYHSHPDAPARPSEFDREHAWPHYAYLIVSVRAGTPEALHAWELSADRASFAPVALEPAPEAP